MKRRHALAGCAAFLAGCTSAHPAAVRGRAHDPAGTASQRRPAPGVDSAAPSPESAGAASSSTVVALAAATTVEPTTVVKVTLPHATTTTTLELPEAKGAEQSDQEWWDSQPGRCGGSLPPCSVMQRESHGDIHATNPTTGASGKWQMMPSTSAALGYARPMATYDEATQDNAAERLWAGGRGCAHWSAC